MTKFDFHDNAFYDNHTHLLFTDKLSVTPEEFAINYYHGIRDAVDEVGKPYPSATACSHLPYQGVIMTLVNAMSQRFECEPTLEAVTAMRNSMTTTPEKLREYTRLLYTEENVVGCTLDCELPIGDEKTLFFPCEVKRLFRYEDVFFSLLKAEENFDNLLYKLLDSVRDAIKQGFSGLKGHIGEKFGFAVQEISVEAARTAFPLAQGGDKQAQTACYYAMFSHLLELCAELDIPLHLHTGTTGFKTRIEFSTVDPILMAPFLKNPRYFRTKIVLLHGSFPYTRHAALMAYNFPNVYLDLSQTLPWESILMPRLFEEALSIAPHDKIMLGTGQHWYCEMVWIAAKIAKSCLAHVMEELTQQNLLSSTQAARSAAMILSENAQALWSK